MPPNGTHVPSTLDGKVKLVSTTTSFQEIQRTGAANDKTKVRQHQSRKGAQIQSPAVPEVNGKRGWAGVRGHLNGDSWKTTEKET